jgi:hypothetical protein
MLVAAMKLAKDHPTLELEEIERELSSWPLPQYFGLPCLYGWDF